MSKNEDLQQFDTIGFRQIKVGAISTKPRKWDKWWNVEQLERDFRRTAQRGVRLAVAPEGFVEGYVVNEVLEDPSLAPQLLDIAEPLTGPSVSRFRELARDLGICLVFGLAERRGTDVYNCAVFVDDTGKIRGAHRKSYFAEGAHKAWYFNRAGDRLRAFDTPLGRAGIVICAERWNPAIVRSLVLDGAQMILIPSFGSRARAQNETVVARARENGVPIVEANVGVNLIVSRGEVAAYHWGCGALTVATIDVPDMPSSRTARAAERSFLATRTAILAQRAKTTISNYGKRCVRPPRP